MCTKLCFLRQGEDTFHRPQTLIVNLLPLCYIRSARFRCQIPGVGCQVSGKRNIEAETLTLNTETWFLTHGTLVTAMSS